MQPKQTQQQATSLTLLATGAAGAGAGEGAGAGDAVGPRLRKEELAAEAVEPVGEKMELLPVTEEAVEPAAGRAPGGTVSTTSFGALLRTAEMSFTSILSWRRRHDKYTTRLGLVGALWLSAAALAYGAVSPRGLFLAPSLQLGTSSCSMPPVNLQNQNVR